MEKKVPDKKLIGIIIKFEILLKISQLKEIKPIIAPNEENINDVIKR